MVLTHCDIGILGLLVRLDDSALVVVIEDIKKDLFFMVDHSWLFESIWSCWSSWYGHTTTNYNTLCNISFFGGASVAFKGLLFSCHERFGLEKRLQYWITTLTPGASALHSRTDDSVIITGGFYLYCFGVRSKNYWYFSSSTVTGSCKC